MPPTTATAVPYGRAALQALRAAIADAKGGDPLAPVTVVVPSNHVGVTARRALASGAVGPVTARGVGLAGVAFLTPYRLAELLGAADLAASGRRPVSTPVLTAAVRGVLGRDPGLFGPVAEHPATEAALVAGYKELRDLPDAALGALAGTGWRARDVVRVHRATRDALAPAWSDEEDLMAAATARVEADPAVVAELGAVVVHLPQRLSLHAATLLRALAVRGPVRVLAGTTGDERADEEVTRSLARLEVDPPAGVDGSPAVTAATTRLISASDADDEVRHAVRSVLDAVGGGTPLDRIAILHPSPDPYARLLHEHLAAADVAVNGPSPVPLAARAAGRALLGLLDLPDVHWSRAAVLDWMATAPLRHEGRPLPVATWERLSRDAGVVAGRDQWDSRLEALAAGREERADEARAAGDDDAVLRHARRAEQARALRSYVLALVDEVERARAGVRSWSDHARWVRRLLDRTLGSAAQRDGWPDVERRAAERIELAVDRLTGLGEVEGPVGLDVVTRTLGVELDADDGRVGRFGDGVLVGPLSMGVGLDLDLVVVVGLAEGLAPRPARDDSLLPDRERRAVDGLLPLRRDGVARQHHQLRAALAAADRHVLTFPRGDLRGGRDRVPSRWLLDVASSLAGRRLWGDDLAGLGQPWFHQGHSFAHAIRTLSEPATAQEHRLRTLLATGAGPGRRGRDALHALDDACLSAGVGLVEGRSSPRFTRFDGNLAGLSIASPADPSSERVASATGLERWARCPFDYFLRSVLGVRELDNPEDAATITALERGSLVHLALERFVLEVLERPADEQPAPTDRWTPADRLRLQEIGAEECDRVEALGLTGRALFWTRERARILADLDATLTFDDTMRAANGSRLLHAELGFGLGDEALPPVTLPLPDGREVRFRGQIDRVDRTPGGLVVGDYKTGSAREYAGLTADDPDQRGTHLQLAVYGAAARAAAGLPDAEVRAEYWFVSTKGGFGSRGYVLTPEISERISDTLRLIVEGIEGGAFPAHPTDRQGAPFNPCWACDPDFLGVADLRKAWEAKSADPALAGYTTLIDPERRPSGHDADADAEVADG
jgi:hypothetical protein